MIRILTLLVSLFTFGLVDLAEIIYEIPVTDMLYFNDTPIEELNDLTLNEVFVDGFYPFNNSFRSTVVIVDNVITVNAAAAGFGSFWGVNNTTIPSNLNDEIYFISKLQNIDIASYSINEFSVYLDSGINLFTINENEFFSFLDIVDNLTLDYRFLTRFGLGYTVSDSFTYKNGDIGAINLTSLGISSLTKAQMDRYYQLWQNPQFNITYEINELDTQDIVILFASQSVWTIMIHLLYKYAYRPKKKSKRLGM
jgi:hypothetical protein